MSLRVEQKIENIVFTENKPRIYTTGAYLVPMKIRIKEEYRYVWVVDEFYDSTFDENEDISPVVYAQDIPSLLNKE